MNSNHLVRISSVRILRRLVTDHLELIEPDARNIILLKVTTSCPCNVFIPLDASAFLILWTVSWNRWGIFPRKFTTKTLFTNNISFFSSSNFDDCNHRNPIPKTCLVMNHFGEQSNMIESTNNVGLNLLQSKMVGTESGP